LKWEFSAKQHPATPPQSELCWSWQSLSGWQARNERAGSDSNWQCTVIGSQTKAASANKMLLKNRTT